MAKRCVLVLSAVLTCCACPARTGEPPDPPGAGRSWPDLTQKPYEHLPTPDIGLKPLLLTQDGQAITTREAWEMNTAHFWCFWMNRRIGRPSPGVSVANRGDGRPAWCKRSRRPGRLPATGRERATGGGRLGLS
jgi:hypothetical protein